MQRARLCILRLSVLAALFCAAVYGQLSTSSLNGTVRDTSGSLVPGASVVLRNVDTGVERQTVTNDAGNYVFLNIIPGKYTLEAVKQGFSKSSLAPFTLEVNQTATFDFSLKVGGVEQTVTVEAIGAEIQASTAEVGAVVNSKQVVDLPLNGRNFTQLLTLTPGVAPVSVSQNSGSWISSPIGSYSFPAINGQTNRSNFFLMDGVSDQAPYTSVYAVPPIVDAIQEFKVQSHNDQAEFGGATGGIINVVTKSGTNELHGTAWEYVRNNAFDARNRYLANVTPFKQNMYGVTVGGPVILPKIYNGRNKTFFFVGYQGFRYRRNAETLFRVPTAANLGGDLSDWPTQIYNPYSTRPDPNKPGSYLRDPFPRNQIPANLIDPGMVLYAKTTLPTPIATGVADRNALDTTPFKQSQEEYTARVDQNLGTKDFFWFRYSGRLQDIDSSGGRQALANINENRSRDVGLSLVHVFNPSTVLQIQYGRVLVKNPYGTKFRSLPANFAQDVGFSSQFAGGFIGGATLVPGLTVPDFFSGGDSGILKSKPVDIDQIKANLSKIHGNHTLKFGGEFNQTTHFNDVTQVSASFAAFQTADPENPGNTGSALASYLLNVPDGANRRNTHDSTRWGGVEGAYFQDQWKVTPRLTVNLGLRYDITFRPPYGRPEDNNMQVGDMNFNNGTYVLQVMPTPCAQTNAPPCNPDPSGNLPAHVVVDPRGKIYHNWTDNWQPRLGMAYRLSDRTALRAGFGMFFESWAALTQSAQNYSGTWPTVGQQIANNLNNPKPGVVTPTIKATNPFPSGLFPEPTPFNQVQWFMDPNDQNAYSMQWNFGIQHQVNTNTVVSASYVGSGSRRLNLGGYYNVALTPGPGDPRARSLYPYIAPTYYDRSWGRSSYHSFQFMLDKHFSNGLAYMLSYTWSKAIDIGCSGWFGVEGCSVQDPYHFNNDRGVSGFDVPHVLTVNWLYQLPIGKDKWLHTGNRAADYILGNWQLNGITVLRSGIPYTVMVSGDIANTGNTGYERLNLVGNPTPANQGPNQWLVRSAFAVPAPYTFGALGRDAFRSDWSKNVDLSIFRQFPIRESKSLEFRAEAFNVFNVTVYNAPVTDFSSPNFGRVLGINNSPRQLQLGAKIIF
ncbi:MAG TPA: TonB-dependent receptor [Bryobacteraceae bacterium]|nr:TonB-dependent receptor [Bryobacteraceae bacterium]